LIEQLLLLCGSAVFAEFFLKGYFCAAVYAELALGCLRNSCLLSWFDGQWFS
jgi:hypothetical protein